MTDTFSEDLPTDANVQKLTRLRLDALPLPAIDYDDDTKSRGVVLAIGGSTNVLGAILLSGTAALRAGAGQLQIAAPRVSALPLGIAIPEAMVFGVPVTHRGEIDGTAASKMLKAPLSRADAVLLGPGIMNLASAVSVTRRLIPLLSLHTTLVLDGSAILALGADERLLHDRPERSVISPRTREIAALLDIPEEEVRVNAMDAAQHCADRFQTVVVLQGHETWIASPAHPIMHYRDGKAAPGTSGSGDVLCGIVAGLAARGASPMTAAAWGVWSHGTAGNKLTRRVGKLGFLARELLEEIPSLISD